VTALTPAVKEVAAGAVEDGGTTVVVVLGVVVVGVVEVDVALVDVLVDGLVDVDVAAAPAGDDVGELRAVELLSLHALRVNKRSVTESAVRSQ
jgi:hypothetical protein